MYEFVDAKPLDELDSLGLCGDCKSRGGKQIAASASLVDNIIESEIDELFDKWKLPSDRKDKDIPEISRLSTAKTKYLSKIYFAYHQKRYSVTCCKEKDGSMTIEEAKEIELRPRSSQYDTGSFTVPAPWILNSQSKDAYVAFALPVPYWIHNGIGDVGACLKASGLGDFGPKIINKDSKIEGGKK